IAVIGCKKLKDTEWLTRQDPYVCVEYGSNKSRTRTCTDGGRNPSFQEKFVFTLIDGLRELSVVVWNSNTLTYDDFIGNGKVQLEKVLAEGYDDSNWPLQTKTGKYDVVSFTYIVLFSSVMNVGYGDLRSANVQ
ncbi:Elicitor-responsive protein 3, partial [Linum perenne]